MSIADFFFGRKQNKTNSRRSVKLNRNAVRTRTLSMEPLETRDLLSVTTGPISDSDYDALRTQYPDFNLPADQSTLNVMTVDCNLSDLKSAISTAGTTEKSDLILVKTTNSANTITYSSSSDEISISVNASQYGSVTIIGWGTKELTLNAYQKCRVLSNSTNLFLGNMILTKGKVTGTVSGRGGGIISYGSLTLNNCTVSNNAVSVSCTSTPSSSSSILRSYGAGIYSTGSLTLTNCTISSNSISNSSSISYSPHTYGGGIYSTGSSVLTNCTISNNSVSSSISTSYGATSFGGGIAVSSTGSLTLENCTILNNNLSASSRNSEYAFTYGSGIYSNSTGSLNLTNSNINSVYMDNPTTELSIIGCNFNSPGQFKSSGTTLINNSSLSSFSITISGKTGTLSIIDSTLTKPSISISNSLKSLSIIDSFITATSQAIPQLTTSGNTEINNSVLSYVSIPISAGNTSILYNSLTHTSISNTGSGTALILDNALTNSSISISGSVSLLSIKDKMLTDSSVSVSGDVTELSVNESALTNSSVSISGDVAELSVNESSLTNSSVSVSSDVTELLVNDSDLTSSSISILGSVSALSIIDSDVNSTSAKRSKFTTTENAMIKNSSFNYTSVTNSDGIASYLNTNFNNSSVSFSGEETTFVENTLTTTSFSISSGNVSVGNNSLTNSSAYLSISGGDLSISDNSLTDGAYISISDGNVSALNNSIIGNGSGKGISISGGKTTILNNTLTSASISISDGEALFRDSSLASSSVSISGGNTSILDCSLTNAPVSISGGKASLVNSSLTDGAYISITGGKTSIANSSIVGTGSGKGIDITSGGVDTNLIVSNSLIRDYEYGIYTKAQVNAAIVNSTITNNSSYGVCVDYSSALFNICNSIVARNYFFSDVYKVADATVNAYNSLSSYTNWTVGYDNIFYIGSIPLFADEDNSDYRLAENSPAINTGNNAYAVDPTGQALTTDLAGNPRILDSRVDIGAYEYDSTSYTKLSVPEFTVSANGTTAIVNISPVENASAYQIEYSLNSDFTGAAVLDAQAGENAISNLQESQTYYIRVKALGEANYSDSDFSETASVTIDVPATPLTGLTLSTTTPEVGMTITTELTPSDATANYQWYSGETAITGATESSFTVTEEQIGQTIKCVATGTGSFTGEVSAATTVAVPVPTASLSAPTELTLSALNTRVTAAWSAVENASSYTLLYQIDGTDGWTTITDIQGTSTSFIGTIDTTYNVKVKANGTDDYSDSPYSEIETISLDVVVKPTIAINGKKVTVKWNDDSPAADAVRYRAVGATKWTVKKLKAGVTEFSFNGALGTNYEIEVLLDQQETNVLQGSATVLDQAKLKADKAFLKDDTFQVSVTNYAAKNLAASAKQAIVVVNGVQTAFNIENQQGESDLASGGKVAFANGLFTFSEMNSNTSYKVQISFSDGVSVSTASAALTVKTLKSPYLAPVITSATAVSDASITVTWETAYGKGTETPAQKYTVQYSLDGVKWSNATTAATGNSYTIQRLKGGNVYKVRVLASKDSAFEASAPSEVLTAETLTAPKTAIEKNSIKDDSFQVNVTNYQNTNLVKATSINVKSDMFGEAVIHLENGAGSSAFDNGMTVAFNNGALTFANAPSNTQQKIQVNFSDGVCTTAWSAALTVKTAIASYNKPILTSATAVSSTSVQVEWSPAVGKNTDIQALSYTVQYSTDGNRWTNANTKVVGTSFTITGLKTGTTYLVAVIANKDARFNASLPSESQQVATL